MCVCVCVGGGGGGVLFVSNMSIENSQICSAAYITKEIWRCTVVNNPHKSSKYNIHIIRGKEVLTHLI